MPEKQSRSATGARAERGHASASKAAVRAYAASLPDLERLFVTSSFCAADIALTTAHFAELSKLAPAPRGADEVRLNVSVPQAASWLHLRVSLSRPNKRGLSDMRMWFHPFKPDATEKERLDAVPEFLDELGKLSSNEVTLDTSINFRFPRDQFAPAIALPETSGLDVSLGAAAKVKIGGVRFTFDEGPVTSVIFDVAPTFVFIVVGSHLTRRLERNLPASCVFDAHAFAIKLVVPSLTRTEGT